MGNRQVADRRATEMDGGSAIRIRTSSRRLGTARMHNEACAEASSKAVEEALLTAWRHVAPKRLAAKY
jgi:hypothetical protein